MLTNFHASYALDILLFCFRNLVWGNIGAYALHSLRKIQNKILENSEIETDVDVDDDERNFSSSASRSTALMCGGLEDRFLPQTRSLSLSLFIYHSLCCSTHSISLLTYLYQDVPKHAPTYFVSTHTHSLFLYLPLCVKTHCSTRSISPS